MNGTPPVSPRPLENPNADPVDTEKQASDSEKSSPTPANKHSNDPPALDTVETRTASIPDLPQEVKEVVFRTLMSSKTSTIPELKQAWRTVGNVSRHQKEFVDRESRYLENRIVSNALNQDKTAYEMENTANWISGVSQGGQAITGWDNCPGIREVSAVRVPATNMAPMELTALLEDTVNFPNITLLEIDLSQASEDTTSSSPDPAGAKATLEAKNATLDAACQAISTMNGKLKDSNTKDSKSADAARQTSPAPAHLEISLNLNGKDLSMKNLQSFRQAWKSGPMLTTVHMKESDFGGMVKQEVMESITEGPVRHLDVGFCRSYHNRRDDAKQDLGHLLINASTEKNLHTLDFTGNQLGNLSGGLIDFHVSKVDTLILDDNTLHDTDIDKLGSILCEECGIRTLSLRENRFSDEGIARLQEMAGNLHREFQLVL